MSRKWSLHLEGLAIYITLLSFFWRDGQLLTVVWMALPFLIICAITSAFEVYRQDHCSRGGGND